MKKPKLKWTKKLPTVDGFYWWRYGPKDTGPNRAIVEGEQVGCLGFYINLDTLQVSGQWYGPIPSKEPE